jgi:putative peptidoglycan lipid II flippase
MNVFLSIVLSRIWGIIGVTLGTCLSSVVGLLITYLFLKKYINNYPIRYHLITLFKCLPFAGLLGAFCWAIVEYSCVSSVIKLVLFLLGFIIYIFILKFLRISEINEVVHILFGRIKCRNAAKK